MKNLLWIIYLQLLRTVSCICDSTSSDVCQLYNNQELPHIYTRHPSTGHSSLTDDTKYCDLFALNQNTWYRSSYNLVTECVDHRKCGTEDPIWLNGTLPDDSDGTVDGIGCVRTFTDCCEQSLNLKIRNCTYYMVYCFTDLHANCHSRYCLDTDLKIETTTTSTTKTTTTTTATTSIAATTCRCEDCKCPKDSCKIINVVLGSFLALNVIGVFFCIKNKLCNKKTGHLTQRTTLSTTNCKVGASNVSICDHMNLHFDSSNEETAVRSSPPTSEFIHLHQTMNDQRPDTTLSCKNINLNTNNTVGRVNDCNENELKTEDIQKNKTLHLKHFEYF